MYEQIRLALDTFFSTHLVQRVDTKRLIAFLRESPDILTIICDEFDEAISTYNKYRKTVFPPYLINAIELNMHFNHDLPIFKNLILSADIIEKIGSQLRDDPYFIEVWKINDSYELICNIVLLLYRNYLLSSYSSLLVNSDGSRKVQISSSIEEMVFQLEINGNQLGIRQAFTRWLNEWKEEGFSKELFLLINRRSEHSIQH